MVLVSITRTKGFLILPCTSVQKSNMEKDTKEKVEILILSTAKTCVPYVLNLTSGFSQLSGFLESWGFLVKKFPLLVCKLNCCHHMSHRTLLLYAKSLASRASLATLTPTKKGQFEQVLLVVGVEHLYQQEVEVEGLDGHPGEAAEQGVMHEGRKKYAHPVGLHRGPPLSQQEG